MTKSKDIFGRIVGLDPAHMNTFLRLNEAKTNDQLQAESGYGNTVNHIQSLRKQGKVASVDLGGRTGYVINAEWFNKQPEADRHVFLESCGLGQKSTIVSESEASAKTQYWCLNFDHEICLQHGMQNNLWLMQYQYPDLLGNEFQGGNQKGATTRNWKRLGQIRPGDKVVAYLSGNKFFATGTVIAPRHKKSSTDKVDTIDDYIARQKSHRTQSGFVFYTDAFYENFDDPWRHPVQKLSRYAQRIDVDQWTHVAFEGVSVRGLGDLPPHELQMAAFKISSDLFDSIDEALSTVSSNEEASAKNSELPMITEADLMKAESNLVETGYFIPADLVDAREKVLAEIVKRRGQPKFRKALLKAYDSRCAVTRCDAEFALEAAHIIPYCGDDSDHVSNGLLLRADIHTLFDLGLLRIHPETLKVHLCPELQGSSYSKHNGQKIEVPKNSKACPNADAFRRRWQAYTEENGT